MGHSMRAVVMVTTCLLLLVGVALTGCSKDQSNPAAGVDIALGQYLKGSTVDFDEATINTMAEGGGEPGWKTGTAAAIYPSTFATMREIKAAEIFGATYRGLPTTYDGLSAGDQSTVDMAVYNNLTASQQEVVTSAITGFTDRYDTDVADATPLEENTAYGILTSRVTADAAESWKADAEAWMTALDDYCDANYDTTYALATLTQKYAAKAAVDVIDPMTALYVWMVKDSFRNGTASSYYPEIRDDKVEQLYSGKTYDELNPVTEQPVVDAAVYASLTAEQKALVADTVAGIFALASEQRSDPKPLDENVYYTTLTALPAIMLKADSGSAAAESWLTNVTGTTPGTGAEAAAFYWELLGGQATWKNTLATRYYGASSYADLTPAQQAVIDQADTGMAGLATVQRLAPLPYDQNVIYTTVLDGMPESQAGWEADVTDGMNMEWAAYKWLVYPSFRNATAVTFYPERLDDVLAALKAAGVISSDVYADLDAYESMVVDATLWNGNAPLDIDPLPAPEQGYVTDAAIPGMAGLIEAQMTDAVPLDQTIAYLTLKNRVNPAAADGWKADVEAGVHVWQAFYRWLAKQSVAEMASAATMIRLSLGEFSFKITNDNDFDVTIDSLNVKCQATPTGSDTPIDAARIATSDKIFVPANTEVNVTLYGPIKVYDMLAWLVTGGTSRTEATQWANDVFDQVQAGTVEWSVTVDAVISSDTETEPKSYTTSWAPAS